MSAVIFLFSVVAILAVWVAYELIRERYLIKKLLREREQFDHDYPNYRDKRS